MVIDDKSRKPIDLFSILIGMAHLYITCISCMRKSASTLFSNDIICYWFKRKNVWNFS